MKYIVAVIVLASLSWARHPVHAREYLYHPHRSSVMIGQPSTIPSWRLVSDHERHFLNWREQSSLQPNLSYHALFTPNDTDYSYQWNFQALNIPSAWDEVQATISTRGDSRVVVAVLDTGLATAAPDLTGLHLWTNSSDVANDGIDNDHDGFVDDVQGWDFVNNDNAPADDNGHGTHIVGTIAETTNNAIAAAGIADGVTIMPLKVLDGNGNGTTNTITAAITFAVAHGATIINLSLGGSQDDPILHQAIQSAVSQGVVVVAASGNDGTSTLNYPAIYSEVIAVGGVQADLTRAGYSSYGTGLDVMAPGGNIGLDQNHDGFGDGILQQTCSTAACSGFSSRLYEGTSQAAAHVSGVAALLISCGESAGSVQGTLQQTATDLGPTGYDAQYGYGLVNAAAAVQTAGCVPITAPTPPANLRVVASVSVNRRVTDGQLVPYDQPVFVWDAVAGMTYQVAWARHGSASTTVDQPTTTYSPVLDRDGQYDFSVVAVNAVGDRSATTTFTYRYRRPALVAQSGSTVRLYDRRWHVIRQTTVKGTWSSLGGGPWSSDQSNRIFLTRLGRPSSDVVLTTSGRTVATLQPFGASFRGDMTNVVLDSGTSPTLVVATASQGASIAWYATNGHMIRRQLLYQNYRGGLSLAAGDLDGDGQDELIVGQVRGAEIRVYSNSGRRLSVLAPLGRAYQGGWLIGSGDSNDDGNLDIVAVAKGGGSKHPALAMTLHGTTLYRWTISTGTYRGPIAMTVSAVLGDGRDRLYVSASASTSFIQRWSLTGNKEEQTSIRGWRGILLSTLQ